LGKKITVLDLKSGHLKLAIDAGVEVHADVRVTASRILTVGDPLIPIARNLLHDHHAA